MSIASRITAIEGHIEEAYTEIARLGVDLTNVDKNIDNIADKLQDIYADLPKVSGEGSNLSLSPTRVGGLAITPEGACEQDTIILPSEYQQVEYIQSSGTQYIDTGYKGALGMKIISKFERPYETVQLFSAYTNSSNRLYAITTDISHPNKVRFSYNGFDTFSYDITGITDIVAEAYIGSTNQYIKINGVDAYNYNRELSELTNNKNLYLFWTNGTPTQVKSITKLYYAKVYENDILVHNYIPCYRKNDNEIGLYDLVDGTFYTNAGTGTFTKGNDVSIPNPDYPQNIRVVTGNNSVVVQNKNLLSSVFQSGSLNLNNGNITTNDTRVVTKDYIPIDATKTYVISGSSANGGRYGCFYDKDKHFIHQFTINTGSGETGYGTFSASSYPNAKYIRYHIVSYTEINNHEMLELGTTASTTYVAHAEQTATLNLGTEYLAGIGTYINEIVGKTNDWKIVRKAKKELLKNMDWSKPSTQPTDTSLTMFTAHLTDRRVASNVAPLCNYLSYKGTANSSSNGKDKGVGFWFSYNSETLANNIYAIVPNSIASNSTAFINWADTNNVTMCYELAESTETPIVDTDIITQLNAIYDLLGYDGQTNITITSAEGNAQMIAQVSALKGE